VRDEASEIEVGDQLGCYRIVGKLAGGAYRAVHVSEPRRVVIEVAPADHWRETAAHMAKVQRMVEALQHPGTARVVDRGVLEDHRPWMATEMPTGMALHDMLASRPMGDPEITRLVRDIADVLAHAHGRGIHHGVLTLRSVTIVTGKREYPISIGDWGGRVTDAGVYRAPEGDADGRTDVYALGVLAYRAATEKFPNGPVDHVPGVSPGLETLILRMLAHDVGERPTAAEVRALANEVLRTNDDDTVVTAIAAGERAATEPPDDLMTFADDDVVHVTPPRFAKPRWTPAPPITSERAPSASGEIDDRAKSDN
jgi:serine/threonine-protein kinase